MLSKKPVIAANHGGLIEIVINKETGLLFEPKNEIKLAEAISILLEDKEKRIVFGQKGYERVLKEFSLEKHVSKFENIFEKLIN